jgi:hypothetical protein
VSTAQLESLVTASRQETALLRGEVHSKQVDNATLRQNVAALAAEREQVKFSSDAVSLVYCVLV